MNWENLIRYLLSAALGTLGFGWLVHAPRRDWLPAALLGGVIFALYQGLDAWGLNDSASLFLASMAGAVAALTLARRLQTIGTTFLMLSIVSFVPGLGLYRSMQFLGNAQIRAGAEQGVSAMIIIVMIALGQATGSLLFRLFRQARPARKPESGTTGNGS